jgi:hypothetical protein
MALQRLILYLQPPPNNIQSRRRRLPDMNKKELIEKLRQKYLLSPPDGMTRQDILHMTDGDLLDMDYFLNEEDTDDDFGEDGFYIF